jgi:TrmH family RNA methyltransferase
MLITSLDNNKIKEIIKLNSSKYRKEGSLFVVEGYHLVEEAYKANLLIEVFILDGKDLQFEIEKTYVNENVMRKITSLESYSEVIGICKMKEDNITGNHILMLDNIQDPGNLGTIIRSAVAFNIDTIVMSYDTVDIYNPKVVRASQGMLFHLNLVKTDLTKTINDLKEKGYKIYSTDVENGIEINKVQNVDKYVIIIGNEGNGIKKGILSLSDEKIYIKMNDKCESLNAGVAASIILYELSR